MSQHAPFYFDRVIKIVFPSILNSRSDAIEIMSRMVEILSYLLKSPVNDRYFRSSLAKTISKSYQRDSFLSMFSRGSFLKLKSPLFQ